MLQKLGIKIRYINLGALLFCLSLLVTAFYFEFAAGLTPCPLCIAQRLVLALLALIFLAATLHNPHTIGARIYATLNLLASLFGASLATRQIWLELNPPPATDSCMPGFSFMIQHLPLAQTLKMVLTGSGQCSEVAWRFLGISMAGWTLLVFLAFISLCLWQFKLTK